MNVGPAYPIFDTLPGGHPHIWGTDEFMQKHLHDDFAPEVISS